SFVISNRKRRIAVGIELHEVDIPIRQLVETRRSQKRLCGLDQQNGLGKTVVVETTPEVNARLDRHDRERTDVQPQRLQRERLHDLRQIGGKDQHIVAAEFYADPELTVAF